MKTISVLCESHAKMIILIDRAIVKTIYVRNLMNDLNQQITIRSRLGYGGVKADITCIDSIIPDITPFDFFKMLW